MTRAPGDPITPRQRRWLVAVTVAVVTVGTLLVFRRFPREEIGGQTWLRTLECDFRKEWCPAGWGWGTWKLGTAGLIGAAPADSFAVYFFGQPSAAAAPVPASAIGNSDRLCDYFRHGGDFVMETEVRLLSPAPGRPAEAQLLIRESNAVMDETGLALVAGRPTAIVRYRAGGIDHVLGNWPIAAPVTYGRWYRISFISRGGHIRAELDGAKVFDSRLDSAVGPSTLPPGRYIEPHIAVKNGSAEFRSVRLFVQPGDRWAFVR